MDRAVEATFRQCALSMLVTSVTTAVAFFASYISSITAIKCFSLFAGVAILTNLLLMMTFIPAALVFYQRYCHATCCCCLREQGTSNLDEGHTDHIEACGLGKATCKLRFLLIKTFRGFFEMTLPSIVLKAKYLWLLGFGGLVAGSAVVVFHSPGLRLPDSETFQLLLNEHVFEKYDRVFSRRFGFEEDLRRDLGMRMPLRFVWGLKPVDDGDYLNPADKGSIEMDPDFDISTSDAQRSVH